MVVDGAGVDVGGDVSRVLEGGVGVGVVVVTVPAAAGGEGPAVAAGFAERVANQIVTAIAAAPPGPRLPAEMPFQEWGV